jgi:serine/threonine-protein kinase
VFNTEEGLYLRSLDSDEAKVIPGTKESSNLPFFSPDGEWIGFFSGPDRQLKKIPINGGPAVPLCPCAVPFGASWSADNTIVFGQQDGIWSVSGNGGEPKRIVEAERGEQMDSPQLLPGDWVLFTSTRSAGPNRWADAEIVAASLKSKQRKTLWRGASDGRYIQTGHLVYAFDDVLYAVPFDLTKMEPMGGQVPIVAGVRRAINPASTTSTANYAVSDNGTLVYVKGSRSTDLILALVERGGAVQRLSLPPKPYINPSLSPDEKKIVVETEERAGNVIWLYDLGGASDMRQLTLKGTNGYPIWAPDSRRIAFASDQDGGMGIYTQSIDGTSTPARLTAPEKGVEHRPESWSPDGKTLSFSIVRGSESGVWTVSVDTGVTQVFADEPGSIQRGSAFSADGKWIAYHSQEAGGRSDVYAKAFPGGPKKRITHDGRVFAIWPWRGTDLIYSSFGGTSQLYARTISLKDGVAFGHEQLLSLPTQFINTGSNRNYDVSSDGKRFLMILPANEATSRPQIHIVLNWFEELKQKVPLR